MAVEATPTTPASSSAASQSAVKIPTPDLVLFGTAPMPIEVMSDLIFEDIGGIELLSLSRSDMVNGQDILYSPIRNLSSIFFQYNPLNLIAMQGTIQSTFDAFPLKFEQYVPENGNGPDGAIVYIDSTTGDLVINVVNLGSDENVRVEIQVNGTKYNATIYGAG